MHHAGTDSERHEDSSLREYGRVLWRRKWIILSVAIAAPLVAVLLSLQQTPKYQATSQVLLSRQNLATSLTGVYDPSLSQPADRFAQTQADLARVPAVAQKAIDAAGLGSRITAGALLANSSVAVAQNADLLDFEVRNTSRQVAASLATQYAKQFTVYRQDLDTRALRLALAEVDKSISKLEGNGDTSSSLYQSLVDKRQQLHTLEALQTSNAYVVRPAGEASQVEPRPVRNGVLGLVLGLALGVILAFVVEAFDTRPRNTREVSHRLGLPLLGRLPAPNGKLRRDGQLVTLAAPNSIEAESFRMLRTNVELANLRLHARTIMVTSATSDEGKSTTAANLAVAFANEGRRVLLVDLDLRQPVQASLFGVAEPRFLKSTRPPGIVDVVLGRAPVDSAIVPIPIASPRLPSTYADGRDGEHGAGTVHGTNGGGGNGKPEIASGVLGLLPAGTVPENAGEFIGARALESLLEEIAGRADLVLVDSPPLLQVGDGLALSRYVDALLVVSRMGATRRSTLFEMRRVLDTCPASKLGFVLTNVEATDGYGYSGYYEAPRSEMPTSAQTG